MTCLLVSSSNSDLLAKALPVALAAIEGLPLSCLQNCSTRPMDRDDELLRLIGRGEEAAFRELVERHVDRACALALRNQSDAGGRCPGHPSVEPDQPDGYN